MSITTQIVALSASWEDERSILQSLLMLSLMLFLVGSEAREQRLQRLAHTAGPGD